MILTKGATNVASTGKTQSDDVHLRCWKADFQGYSLRDICLPMVCLSILTDISTEYFCSTLFSEQPPYINSTSEAHRCSAEVEPTGSCLRASHRILRNQRLCSVPLHRVSNISNLNLNIILPCRRYHRGCAYPVTMKCWHNLGCLHSHSTKSTQSDHRKPCAALYVNVVDVHESLTMAERSPSRHPFATHCTVGLDIAQTTHMGTPGIPRDTACEYTEERYSFFRIKNNVYGLICDTS
jgi:hypothetical protein